MKQIFSIVALLTSSLSLVHGQAFTAITPAPEARIAFTNSAFAGVAYAAPDPLNEYRLASWTTEKKHQRIVRRAKTFLIIGGSELAAAELLYLTVTPSKDIFTGIIETIGFGGLLFSGARLPQVASPGFAAPYTGTTIQTATPLYIQATS